MCTKDPNKDAIFIFFKRQKIILSFIIFLKSFFAFFFFFTLFRFYLLPIIFTIFFLQTWTERNFTWYLFFFKLPFSSWCWLAFWFEVLIISLTRLIFTMSMSATDCFNSFSPLSNVPLYFFAATIRTPCPSSHDTQTTNWLSLHFTNTRIFGRFLVFFSSEKVTCMFYEWERILSLAFIMLQGNFTIWKSQPDVTIGNHVTPRQILFFVLHLLSALSLSPYI